MFLALGVGGFSAAVFHVTTHAFFKAPLFLAAGSVIHALGGEQDITKMGGLKSKIPITFVTFLFSAIALSGVPPFAGFFSKDEILGSALASGHTVLFALGMLTAILTAFYTFRLLYLVFYGESRLDEHTAHHVHESPPTMTIPLVVLATLSAVGGLLSAKVFGVEPLTHFLAPVFARTEAVAGHAPHLSKSVEITTMLLSIVSVGIGIAIALSLYRGRAANAEKLAARFPRTYRLVENKYFVDEAYDKAIVEPLRVTAEGSAQFDKRSIDGVVNGIASLSSGLGTLVRILQAGTVHTYVFWFLVGAVALVSLFI
jgi:NADH-quinone oxidoreductase subunit L